LQEIVQSQNRPTPKYKVTEESGPDHNKKFIVEVTVAGKSLAKGKGKNKSEAEQDAAKAALDDFAQKM
jgi:ribonuclease-3